MVNVSASPLKDGTTGASPVPTVPVTGARVGQGRGRYEHNQVQVSCRSSPVIACRNRVGRSGRRCEGCPGDHPRSRCRTTGPPVEPDSPNMRSRTEIRRLEGTKGHAYVCAVLPAYCRPHGAVVDRAAAGVASAGCLRRSLPRRPRPRTRPRTRARQVTNPIERNMMIPLWWFADGDQLSLKACGCA